MIEKRHENTDWVLSPLEVKASSQTSSHQTSEVSVFNHFIGSHGSLTVLYPSVTKGVDTFRLVLSNDAVTEGGARKKVEDSISVGALGLFVAEALWSRVSLHLAIKGGSSCNVDSIIGNNVALRYGECGDREGESVRWAGRQVGLSGIGLAFDLILSLVDSSCLKQCRRDGSDGSSGELHID